MTNESIVISEALNNAQCGQDVYDAFLEVPECNLEHMRDMIIKILLNKEEK